LPLTLSIGVLPVASLNSPILTDAVDGVLDVTKLGANAVIRALDWPLIAVNQHVWMRLSGKKADGTEHKLDIWSGGASFVNPTWFAQKYWPRNVAKSYFTELADNSPLTLSFKAALDQSGIEDNAVVFADQVYTVKAFEVVVPTITEAKDSKGVVIPQGGTTVDTSVTLTGTASKGQSIKILDGTVDKGDAVADLVTGVWTKILTGLSLAPHSFTAKALYGSGETSAARTLTVTATTAPTITEAKDSKGVVIPQGGITVDTTVTLTGTASNGQSIKILDGTVDKGDAVADPVTGIWTKILTGLSLAAHSFTAKALYGTGQTSAARTLTVTATTAPTITEAKDSKGVVIPQGGITVDTSVTLTGTASKGLSVKVLDGTVDKGDAVADPVTGIWTKILTGLSLAAHSFTAKALYGTGQTSAARTLTVTATTAPTITEAKDSKGVVIPQGGTTVDTSVTLTGTASKGLSVKILDGATDKGDAVADPATGIWTKILTGLSLAAHSFTAKALYGTGQTSADRTLTVRIKYSNFTPFTGSNGNGWVDAGGFAYFASENSNIFFRKTQSFAGMSSIRFYVSKFLTQVPVGGNCKVSFKYRLLNTSGQTPIQYFLRCYFGNIQDSTTFPLNTNGAWNAFSRDLPFRESDLVVDLEVHFPSTIPQLSVHLDLDDILIEEI
ncbi:hypothetical protein ABE529_23155, partial [Pseudomonas koreensis]